MAAQLEDDQNELWLSPISVWEALMLAERGRVELDRSPSEWVNLALREVPLRDALLTREVAISSRTFTLAHDDPADRFLAATAVVFELTLVTADRRLLASRQFRTLAAHRA